MGGRGFTALLCSSRVNPMEHDRKTENGEKPIARMAATEKRFAPRSGEDFK
jgi:hypothetical protein